MAAADRRGSAAAGGDTARADMEAVPPAKVASRFMQYFYDVMNNHTEYLYQFYRNESCLTVQEVSDEGEPRTANAVGQEDIRHTLDTLYRDVTISIEAHSAQRSFKGSVLLLVTGRMRRQGWNEERFFNQAFLLARQPDGFYVHTDNIIVHCTSSSSLFFAMRLRAKQVKLAGKSEEVPMTTPVAPREVCPDLPQEQVPSASLTMPAPCSSLAEDTPLSADPGGTRSSSFPEEHPSGGKENSLARPSYMEALLKASAPRQALKPLQEKPHAQQAADKSSGAGSRRPEPKPDSTLDTDDQQSEIRSMSVEVGSRDECQQRPRAEEVEETWVARDEFKSRGTSPPRRPINDRGDRRRQQKRGTGLGSGIRERSGIGAAQREGERGAARGRPPSKAGPRQGPAPAQAGGAARTTKMREVERRELVSRRIFVAKLPLGVRREAVEEAFGAFGDVESLVVRGGEKRAFAFITYRSEEAAAGALAQGEVAVGGQAAVARRWIDNQVRERGGRPAGRV